MNVVKRLVRFIKYNEHKSLTLWAWFYSAIFRLQILVRKSKDMKKKWGIEGEESMMELDLEAYRYARRVSYAVNQVCNKTKWESKCLVRALTAQKLLKRKNLSSTLYLGCGVDEKGEMIAHAWIRCGQVYVTGGNGHQYAIVDKFRT